MRHRKWVIGSIFLWLVASVAVAVAEPPAKTVQAFLEANRQGRFAAAQALLLEQADVSASLFSNWLFGGNVSVAQSASADIFLSRKFTAAFSYKIIDTTMSGENQAFVSGIRTSPNIQHLYSWALAPQQGSAPYALIESIDTYLTKINYPLEESRMAFTLVRELDNWLISAIHDERFGLLREQGAFQSSSHTANAAGAVSRPSAQPLVSSAAAATPTTSSHASGREVADAQFNATLQGLNRAPLSAPKPDVAPQPDVAPLKKESVVSKIASIFGRGSGSSKAGSVTDRRVYSRFESIRDALALYAGSNSSVPDALDIHDWPSLRKVVNFYSKHELPISEELAGFSFVDYQSSNFVDYVLLVELHSAPDGRKKVELRPNGIERVN